MIELSQCPNCAETDKVTIAGKVFCAKCGTATDQAAQTTTASTQVAAQPVAPATQPQTSDFPSVQKFQAGPPAAQSVPAPDPIASSEPVQQPVEAPAPLAAEPPVQTPAPQSAPQPSAEPQPVATPAQDTQKLDEQINTLSQSAVPTSPPTESNSATPAAEPVAPLAGLAAPTEAPIAPAPPVSQTPAPMASNPTGSLTDIKPVSRVPEHLGSEIMSLDKKDNTVFSDDQLNELAKITTENPKPNSVIMPEASSTPTTPTVEPEPVTAPIAKAPVVSATTQDIKPPTTATVDSAPPTLDKVVENSGSKNQDEPKSSFGTKTKKGLKPASIALTIVALFLVGAYIWQVNYPSLAFKIASAKAGVSASLPGYVPSGWKMLGDISTNPGTVSYALSSPDNSKKISITQTKTDWDSQALAENYVAPKAENYLALQAQGLTIYVYGQNQASWVNKGTWYKIETTDQSLTQDQIIKIATSL